jgi:arylsulfatase A-like enzyme
MLTLRHLGLLAAIAFATVCSHALAAETLPRRPNILFIISDELRKDAFGFEGHPIVRTPNLDRLAAQSMRFHGAYTTAPTCIPSRVAIFTGRYAKDASTIANPDQAEWGLPEILHRFGYYTGNVGKLHLAAATGSDWWDWLLIPASGNGAEYKSFLSILAPWFVITSNYTVNTATVPGTLYGPLPWTIGTSPLPDAYFEEAWVADRAIDFLCARTASPQPWFLTVSYLRPHSEFVVPEPYATMYPPEDMILPSTFVPGAGSQTRTTINDPAALRQVLSHYYGAVTMVDRHTGRVLDAIDELGFRDNTVVVFMADHGSMCGERNLMFKGVMYEGSAGIPLLIRVPGVTAGNTVTTAVTDNTSITPTMLELMGLAVPANMQGRSLVPVLSGQDGGPGEAFSHFADRMARRGDYKLIVPDAAGSPSQLYNVVADPQELNNLYGNPQYAAIQADLQSRVDTWWSGHLGPIVLPAVPTVVTQPVPALNVLPGATVQFSVAASGTGPLRYAWQKDRRDVSNGGHYSGASSTTLTVTAVDAGMAGNYRCEVSNDGGATFTIEVALTVGSSGSANTAAVPAYPQETSAARAEDSFAVTADGPAADSIYASVPGITQQPVDHLDFPSGQVASFAVSATGGGLSFKWERVNGTLVEGGSFSGVNTNTLSVTADTCTNGYYRCKVSNSDGSIYSNAARLLVVGSPAVPGDFDHDGDVDQEDFGHLQLCLDGDGFFCPDDCRDADLDNDSDVDLSDFNAFKKCLSGAGILASPGCMYQ